MKKNLSSFAILFLVALFAQVNLNAQDLFFKSGIKKSKTQAIYVEAVNAGFNVEHAKFNKLIDKVLKKEPKNFAALTQKAMWAYHTKDLETFNKYAAKAVAENPNSDAQKLYKQILSARLADPKAEVTHLSKQLASENMKVLEAHLMNAVINFEAENMDIATEALFNAKFLAPEYGPTYNMLGYAMMSKGDMEKAGTMFKKYMRLMPDSPNPYDSMGDYLMKKKDYAKAAEMYDKAASMDKSFTVSQEKAAKAKSMIK